MQSAPGTDELATEKRRVEDTGSEEDPIRQWTYEHSTMRDNARVHFGHQHHIHYGPPSHGDDDPTAERRRTIIAALSFDDMDMEGARVKLPFGNTCQWFFDSREYREWRDVSMLAKHHGFLWIRGKPGAGKSTLMRLAVEHVDQEFLNDLRISFFFNARGTLLEKSIEGMYRTLLYQLLDQCPRLEKAFHNRPWNHTTWPVPLLEENFRDCILGLGTGKLTCFIDALDACEESDVRGLVEFFEDLGSMAVSAGTQMHVCFASRHYPHMSIPRCVNLVLDKVKGHQEDIETYVRNNLKVSEPALRDQLAEGIKTQARDVFSWAVLMVRNLQYESRMGSSPNKLRARLDTTPSGFHALLENAIIERGIGDRRYVLPILLWILFSQRPLSPFELYHAVLYAGDGRRGAATIDQLPDRGDIDTFILNASKCLAEITVSQPPSIRPQVRFIHETIGEYLQDVGIGKLESSFCKNPTGMSHDFLKTTCVEYISFVARTLQHTEIESGAELEPLDRKERIRNTFPFLMYALEGSVTHAELAQSNGVSQVSFVEGFPLDQVVKLNNLVSGSRYPPTADMAFIFDVSNAPQLLQLELSKGKSETGQSKATDLTESIPDLTMGSSDRYDPGGVYEHADSIRTDNEDNNLGFDKQLSYSNVFVRELREGLDEVLRSKHCDLHARKRMSAALPDLLKAYALSLTCRARPGFEKKTVIFIRHTRTYVTAPVNSDNTESENSIHIVRSPNHFETRYLRCPHKLEFLNGVRRWSSCHKSRNPIFLSTMIPREFT
jgi:hypothetical protein